MKILIALFLLSISSVAFSSVPQLIHVPEDQLVQPTADPDPPEPTPIYNPPLLPESCSDANANLNRELAYLRRNCERNINDSAEYIKNLERQNEELRSLLRQAKKDERNLIRKVVNQQLQKRHHQNQRNIATENDEYSTEHVNYDSGAVQ